MKVPGKVVCFNLTKRYWSWVACDFSPAICKKRGKKYKLKLFIIFVSSNIFSVFKIITILLSYRVVCCGRRNEIINLMCYFNWFVQRQIYAIFITQIMWKIYMNQNCLTALGPLVPPYWIMLKFTCLIWPKYHRKGPCLPW